MSRRLMNGAPTAGSIVSLLVVAALTIAAAIAASTGLAQAQGVARLELVAQTTYVGADPAVVDVRIISEPTEATLAVRIHEAVSTRSGLQSSISGRPPTEVIGRWTIDDLDSARVGAGDVISIVVPDEEIGELLRRPTDPGVHPLVVDLVRNGVAVDTLVTHLLVLPEGEGLPPALTVALLFDMDVPVTISADGTTSIDETAVRQATELAGALAAWVELPFTIELPPEAFEALERTGRDDTLAVLRTAAVGNSVLHSPWVELEEEAWRRAGREDIVIAMYELGRERLAEVARIASGGTVWLDPSATPETLSLLAADPISADGFIVPPEVVSGFPGGGFGSVTLVDADGDAHPAVVPDTFIAGLLGAGDRELAAQNALAELLRIALAAGSERAGVVVAPDPVDPVTLDLLLHGLDRPSPIVAGTVADILTADPLENAVGEPVAIRLSPEAATDLSSHVTMRSDIETRLAAYSSVLSDEGLTQPLRTLLLASIADSAASERADYLRAIADQISTGLGGIDVVDTGRITITSRRAELPILIRNDQTLPMNVVLALSAEKIDFPGGERQEILLPPGETELLLEVEALASGDSTITLKIESPEGGILLDEGVVRLRSTAISGLGLVISVVALLVLLAWWIRTTIARRRDRQELPASVRGTPDGDRGDLFEETPAREGTP